MQSLRAKLAKLENAHGGTGLLAVVRASERQECQVNGLVRSAGVDPDVAGNIVVVLRTFSEDRDGRHGFNAPELLSVIRMH